MGVFDRICRLLPLSRNKIVFSNFLGNGFGENPKYIAEEIIRRNLPYDLVWLVRNPDEFVPNPIRKVEIYTRNCRWELATARVIISNVKSGLPFQKKVGQYYIQTWHGDFPLKYIEREAVGSLSENYVRASQIDSSVTDLILSGNRFFSGIVRDAFWYDGEILEKGLPRNDIFFRPSDAVSQKIRGVYKIPAGSRILLYAPTFRGIGKHLPELELGLIREKLEQISGGAWSILFRLHNVDRGRDVSSLLQAGGIDVSDYPDVQELECASQLLITDYSSMMYDFAIQGKPVLLFTPDVVEYSMDRGLRPLFYRLPFPRFEESGHFESALSEVLSEEGRRKCQSFFEHEVISVETGHSSEAVVNRIQQFIDSHE